MPTICSWLVQACLRPYNNRGMWLLPQTHLIYSRTTQELPFQSFLLRPGIQPSRFLFEDWAKIAPPASTAGADEFSPPERCGFTRGKPHRSNVTLPSAAHCVHLPGTHGTCVTFSQQGSSFVLRDVLTFSVLQNMFIPKKCLSLAYVSIWPRQAEILQTHVESGSLLESVSLSAMTSTSRSAQIFINKLRDFITICHLWCHCLVKQGTLRLILLEGTTINIEEIVGHLYLQYRVTKTKKSHSVGSFWTTLKPCSLTHSQVMPFRIF